MYNQNNKHLKPFWSVFFSILFISLALFLAFQKQYIIDLFSYWQYQPSSEISSIIDRTGVNDYGKFLFFASQPVLDGTQSFNQSCDRVEQTTSILGCYSEGDIYIYNVTEAQLDGIKEVTAAHEMLHAAYARLSQSEQEKFNGLAETEYQKLKVNQSFEARMEYYEKAEPGQRGNELHSILGTEIEDLSPELEEYYQKYFSDRSEVVALYEKYIEVFNSLDEKADKLSDRLNDLSEEITAQVNEYNQDVKDVNQQITEFNQKAKTGDFTSQSDFYYQRSILINTVENLNITRDEINSMIEDYNSILKEYNSIVIKSEKLYNSIDSTLAPAPSI